MKRPDHRADRLAAIHEAAQGLWQIAVGLSVEHDWECVVKATDAAKSHMDRIEWLVDQDTMLDPDHDPR